jgi:hypothetical protein
VEKVGKILIKSNKPMSNWLKKCRKETKTSLLTLVTVSVMSWLLAKKAPKTTKTLKTQSESSKKIYQLTMITTFKNKFGLHLSVSYSKLRYSLIWRCFLLETTPRTGTCLKLTKIIWWVVSSLSSILASTAHPSQKKHFANDVMERHCKFRWQNCSNIKALRRNTKTYGINA